MQRNLPAPDPSWTLHHDTCSQQEKSIFTLHRIHHFPVRQIVGPPLSSVSTCHLTDRSGKIKWWQKPYHHFLVHCIRLCAPVNLSCSFLVQFLPAATEKRRCQLASRQQQVRHINHLSVYRFPPEANVAWQKHEMNKDRSGCGGGGGGEWIGHHM